MNLNQITIPVVSVEKSIQFYQKLGLKLIIFTHQHYARFVCPIGNTTFSLHHHKEVTNGSPIVIYFEVENVDSEVDRLQSLGIQFETLPIDQPWLWREASLFDLDGHKIIIYHAGENRKNPPWRIKD